MPKYAYIQKEISIPVSEGVSYSLEGKVVTIKGPKGSLTKDFTHAKSLSLKSVDKETILLETSFPRRKDMAMIGTAAGHLKNMINGVTKGYKYVLRITYAHFPITVKVNKATNNVEIQNFVGERGHRYVPIIGDVKVTADKETVTIEGIDKEIVAQNAANIQLRTKIKNKDLRIFQDGVYVYEKWLGDELTWAIKV